MAEDEAGQRGNRSARTVARSLGLRLIAGGALAALGDTGFGRMVYANDGYADFGYIPQQCGDSSRSVRTINGDVVRACQYLQQSRRMGSSSATTPTRSRTRRRRCSSRCPTRSLHFAWLRLRHERRLDVALVHVADVRPRVRGQPRHGLRALRRLGRRHEVPRRRPDHADQLRRVRLHDHLRDHEHQRRRAAHPSAGLDDLLRLLGPPTSSTSAAPRTVTAHNPLCGGSISLSESDVGGSPAVLEFTSGGWTAHQRLRRPQCCPRSTACCTQTSTTWSVDSEMALAWPIRTLAADATAHYSVDDLDVATARGHASSSAAACPRPTRRRLVDASVSDDRAVAGRLRALVDDELGPRPAEGASPIDGSGHATLSIPGRQGYQHLRVYVDNDGDAARGLRRARRLPATLYAPPGGPPPAPPAVDVGEPAGAATRRGHSSSASWSRSATSWRRVASRPSASRTFRAGRPSPRSARRGARASRSPSATRRAPSA